jgi:hypothetical protein
MANIAEDILFPPLALFGGSKPQNGPTVGGVKTLPSSTGDPTNNFINTLSNANTTTGTSAGASGASTFGAGIQAMQPALSYYTKLLGGGAEEQSTLQPEFDQISQQFDQIRNSISATQPRGGGTASTFAAAPQKEAAAKAEIASKARSDAASQLQTAGAQEAGLGEGEQSVGLQALGEALQGALGNKGINTSTDFANQFVKISQGLAALV